MKLKTAWWLATILTLPLAPLWAWDPMWRRFRRKGRSS